MEPGAAGRGLWKGDQKLERKEEQEESEEAAGGGRKRVVPGIVYLGHIPPALGLYVEPSQRLQGGRACFFKAEVSARALMVRKRGGTRWH